MVVVHGMGEQLPLDTMYRCVRTALAKVGTARKYYSRPERLTESFEARRCLAPRIPRESKEPADLERFRMSAGSSIRSGGGI